VADERPDLLGRIRGWVLEASDRVAATDPGTSTQTLDESTSEPRRSTLRRCPFCGSNMRLGECAILATNLKGRSRGLTPLGGDDAEEEQVKAEPVSGAKVLRYIGRYPVVAEPPLPSASTVTQRARNAVDPRRLKPVTELGDPTDRPARACTECGHPLPVEIDHRQFFTLAVLGTQSAGKTHFLASVATQASRRQGLASFGFTEFSPDEATARRIDEDYYFRAFRAKQTFAPTQREDPELRFKPLIFRARYATATRNIDFGLCLHDASGEMLQDQAKRAEQAPFARQADAVIYLIDPLWLEPIRDQLGAEDETSPYFKPSDRYFTQAALLEACITDMGSRGREIPWTIALSKSDVVQEALGRSFRFSEPSPADPTTWFDDAAAIDDEVRSVLREVGALDVLGAAEHLKHVRFTAVAPIGFQPNGQSPTPPAPLRCLDPVLLSLLGMPEIVGVEGQ
jgi:double-GTPase-like protein